MRRYTLGDITEGRHYQLPKFLFEDPKYTGMSLDAKVLYAILRDRLELSRKNNWTNEFGEIYLILQRVDMEELLNRSERTVTRAMNELKARSLIDEERRGKGKPNHIFICHLPDKTRNLYGREPQSLRVKNRKIYGSLYKSETNRNDTNREIEKPHPEIDQAIEAWNAMAQNNGLSKVIKVTDSRRKKMKKIVEEYGSEGWRKILEEITQSEFLLGNNGRNWKITIDWLLNTTNLTKVVEGQYRGSDPRKERFQGKDFSHLEWKGII